MSADYVAVAVTVFLGWAIISFQFLVKLLHWQVSDTRNNDICDSKTVQPSVGDGSLLPSHLSDKGVLNLKLEGELWTATTSSRLNLINLPLLHP